MTYVHGVKKKDGAHNARPWQSHAQLIANVLFCNLLYLLFSLPSAFPPFFSPHGQE
jgi:hypothetical protein